MICGLLATVAVLVIVFACVYKAEGGETYEDRQQKLADKMYGDNKKESD